MSKLEWKISSQPIAYEEAIAEMETRVAAIRAGTAAEAIWLLEHPAIYTAGTSARQEDLLDPNALPVFTTGRGGQYTYHGPGQRIAYAMLDLKTRGNDLRRYVHDLEQWLIDTLDQFNLRGERRAGRVGVWINLGAGKDAKIAAVGIRVRRWVSYHGIAINLDPDLTHYDNIVPCGIRDQGVTSFAALGLTTSMEELDAELIHQFKKIF